MWYKVIKVSVFLVSTENTGREREREREGLEKVERERESVAKQLIAKIVDKMDASEEWLNRKA